MTIQVTIVDADHRPDLYAELEYNGALVAEAFVEDGTMRMTFVGLDGGPLWTARVEEISDALSRARSELVRFGLLE